jgi:YD repeat-containing protein
MTADAQPGVAYTYYDDDQLRTLTSTNVTASLAYDGDGRLLSQTVTNVAANTTVTTTYGYDIASRIASMAYAAGSVNLGNLTYQYDQDGRVLTEGGSLAAINFPAVISASYLNTNQISTWNGVAAGHDAANNLTVNPSTSDAYSWDSKNELSTVNASAYSYLYDAHGRRQSSTTGGVTTTYLYDGATSVESSTWGPRNYPIQDYFYLPDGIAAFSTITASGTTTEIPIQDGLGSTLGLVDSTGSLVTQYT